MTEYTEAQIRELSGRELRVAVHRLVLGDDLTANTEERIGLAVAGYYGRTELSVAFGISSWKSRHYLDDVARERLEQHVANYRAEPLEMGMDWCVPELMGPGKVLEDYLFGWNRPLHCYQVLELWGEYPGDVVVLAESDDHDDPATAIQRAACLVELRKGE